MSKNSATQITRNVYDFVQKNVVNLFKDEALEFYGLKIPKIKESLNIELYDISVAEKRPDLVFLLEDDSLLHIEFQTTYRYDDLLRFWLYDLLLHKQHRRKITAIIIYSADVKRAKTTLNLGSLIYSPHLIMLHNYCGEKMFQELEKKLLNYEKLNSQDILNLLFLPLMQHDIIKEELAIKSMELAQIIEDPIKRELCITSIYAFASKHLDEKQLKRLSEVFKMTDNLVKFLEEALEEKLEEALEEKLEEALEEKLEEEKVGVAKKMLMENMSTEVISKITGLDELTVNQLREI